MNIVPKSNIQWLCSVTLAFFIVFAARDVFAGGFFDITEGEIENLTSILVDKTKERLRKNIAENRPNILAIFDEIEVKRGRGFDIVAEARVENGKKVVEISNGIVVAIVYYYRYAEIINNYHEMHNKKCGEYMDYFSRQMAMDPSGRRLFSGKIYGPEEFCGVRGILELEGYKGAVQRNIVNDSVLHSAIGFVLAHEYAHHILGHMNIKYEEIENVQKIELAADHLASIMVAGSGPLLPMIVIFDYISHQRQGGAIKGDKSHPSDACRTVKIAAFDRTHWRGLPLEMELVYRRDLRQFFAKIAANSVYVEDGKNVDDVCAEAEGRTRKGGNANSSDLLEKCILYDGEKMDAYRRLDKKFEQAQYSSDDKRERIKGYCIIIGEMETVVGAAIQNAQKCAAGALPAYSKKVKDWGDLRKIVTKYKEACIRSGAEVL